MGNRKKQLMHFLRVDRSAAAVSALSSPRSFSSNSSFSDDDGYSSSSFQGSASSSPSRYSPPKSPWARLPGLGSGADDATATGLIASLVKEDGKVYSLAAAGDVLYTGTDSETVRVWRDRRQPAGFRTGSGLVKAIVVAADGRVFTGHQDGKVRGRTPTNLWAKSTLSSRGHTSAPGHQDIRRRWGLDGGGEPRLAGVLAGHGTGTGVLCLAVSGRVVVSGSADGTLCVWRRDDDDGQRAGHARLAVLAGHTGPVKCVAVAADDDGCYDERRFVVYSGSLDGSVKVWRLSEERALEPPAAVEATTALMAALGGGMDAPAADSTAAVAGASVGAGAQECGSCMSTTKKLLVDG